jgi:hypothetical protein
MLRSNNTMRALDLVLIAKGDDGWVEVGELRDVDDWRQEHDDGAQRR